MKLRVSASNFSLVTLIVLFGFGCSFVRQSNSEKSKPPIAKTKITKDNLKARLSGKKVRFIGDNPDQILRVDISMPRLKIVRAGIMPKIDWNGEVFEFSQLRPALRDFFGMYRDKNVALMASEPDIAFYNKEDIGIEDFEWLIAHLDEDVNQFDVYLSEFPIPDKPSPKTTIRTVSPSLPKDVKPGNEEPPLRKQPTPK